MKSKEESAVPASKNRKAYIFSASSALLLIVFGVMYQLNLTPFDEWFTFTLLGILATAAILPFAAKGLFNDVHAEESLSLFADLMPPRITSFSFDVPSLPSYRKLRHAPARIGATLVGLVLLLTFGGGPAISTMLSSGIPFELFLVVASVVILAGLTLIVLFVAATTRELKLRQSFYAEVKEGLKESRYCSVREFDAETTDDRRLLLRSEDDSYSWWTLKFNGATAEAEWDGIPGTKTVWSTTTTGPIALPSGRTTETTSNQSAEREQTKD